MNYGEEDQKNVYEKQIFAENSAFFLSLLLTYGKKTIIIYVYRHGGAKKFLSVPAVSD